MTNLQASAEWLEVRQLETHEFARGGFNGNMNEQAKALLARTEYLKKNMAGITDVTDRLKIEKKSIFLYMSPSEFYEFINSEPRTFDFTNIINRTLASMSIVNGTSTQQILYLPAIKGGYKITDTIWMPKHVGLFGDGGGMFQLNTSDVNKNSSLIYADFDNPYKFVINSDTRLISSDMRITYDQLIEGATIDGGEYTWSDGIKLKGFRIATARRVFGGVKLIGSVESFIDSDVTVTGVEYGYVTSACWNSKHLGNALTYKCGYLSYDAANGTIVEGYLNNSGPPSLKDCNLLNFFEIGYYIPQDTLNNEDMTFGCVLRKSYGVSGNRLITEHSDFPIVLYDRCLASFGTIYAERVKHCAILLGNQCMLDVGNANGGIFDGAAIHLGTHARLNIENYYMIANGRHIYQSGGVWGPTAFAKIPSRYFPDYHAQIQYNDVKDNYIFVRSNGSSSNNGASWFFPTNLTEALRRIAQKREFYDNTQAVTSFDKTVIYLIDNEHSVNTKDLVLTGDILITKRSGGVLSSAKITWNETTKLQGCNLSIRGVNVDIPSKTFDYATVFRNSPFLSESGFNVLEFRSSAINIPGENNAIAAPGNASNSQLTMLFDGGSITGAGNIVGTAESLTDSFNVDCTIGNSTTVSTEIQTKINLGFAVGSMNHGNIKTPWIKKQVSVIYDPPSINVGGTEITTVALPGVFVGTPVAATFSSYNQNIELYPVVSAANTVTVKLKNTGASAVDLSSGTLTVRRV